MLNPTCLIVSIERSHSCCSRSSSANNSRYRVRSWFTTSLWKCNCNHTNKIILNQPWQSFMVHRALNHDKPLWYTGVSTMEIRYGTQCSQPWQTFMIHRALNNVTQGSQTWQTFLVHRALNHGNPLWYIELSTMTNLYGTQGSQVCNIIKLT